MHARPILAYTVFTLATVTTDDEGNFPATLVCESPLSIGCYDIIVDRQDEGNAGYYDDHDVALDIR